MNDKDREVAETIVYMTDMHNKGEIKSLTKKIESALTTVREEEKKRAEGLLKGLRDCISRSGNPSPLEGCLAVVRTAKHALSKYEGKDA